MIILNTTTKSLELVLAGSITTNQLAFVASFVDISQVNFGLTGADSSNGASNDTTVVSMVAAPAADTSRQIKFLSIFNADTAAATVTVQYDDNGTNRTVCKVTLPVGASLVYTDGEGFRVISAAGAILCSFDGAEHNNLANIQGGTSGEYYHLTAAELAKLQANGRIAQDVTPATTSGTSETDLQSLTIPANTFGANGDTVHVGAGFELSVTVTGMTARFYVDGSVVATGSYGLASGTEQLADIELMRIDTDTLAIWGRLPGMSEIPGGPPSSHNGRVFYAEATGLTFSGAIAIKFTGQADDVADNMTQNTMFADFKKAA